MRYLAVLILALSLAACNSAKRNNDAVRQGVVDYLAERGLNVQGMDVSVTKVDVKGNQADAAVSIVPKGGKPEQGMAIQYHLEQRGNKWAVTGRKEAGASPHGGGAMPGMGAMPGGENPHGGGGMPPAASGPGSKMPSPEDLPPVKKP